MAGHPTAAGDRLEGLDALRGIAVMGILMVNVQIFMMYWGAYQHPPAHMSIEGANLTAWFVTHVFFEMKFITLFSALFGAGIMLMVGDAPDADTRLHHRRMRWLLVFGLVHGFVFWFGDILTIYAIFGMVAVMMRRMGAGLLIALGLAGVAFSGLLTVGQIYALSLMPDPAAPQPWGMIPDAETLNRFVSAWQAGFIDSRPYNAIGNIVSQLSSLIGFSGRVLGMMLIGMALFKLGFFSLRWSAARYGALASGCLAVGLPLIWMGAEHAIATDFDPARMWAHVGANYALSPVVALGYASLVMLACKTPWLRLARYPFVAAGRMAFTNYLTQTLIMTFLAVGGIGLGLYGQIERAQQVQLVIAVWVALLVISPIWLHFFRYGPFEWLWRSLSYKKAQPFVKRRERPAPASVGSRHER